MLLYSSRPNIEIKQFLTICLPPHAAGGIMLSGCPSVRLSVCLSVWVATFFDRRVRQERG